MVGRGMDVAVTAWAGALFGIVGLSACSGQGPVGLGADGMQDGTFRAALVELGDDDEDFDPDDDFDFDAELAREQSEGLDGEPTASQAPPHLRASIRRMFDDLQSHGSLGEGGWQLGTAPPAGMEYTRIPVRDDVAFGISDGFEVCAWLPIDEHGTPRADDVYMVKRGGFAGWQFTAGPFILPADEGLLLGAHDHGRRVAATIDAPLTVRLPSADQADPAAGWEPAPGALVPAATHHDHQAGDDIFYYDLELAGVGAHALSLQQRGRAESFRVDLQVEDRAGSDGGGSW